MPDTCVVCAHQVLLPGTTPCCNRHELCFLCLKRLYLARNRCPFCRSRIPHFALAYPQALGTLTMQEDNNAEIQDNFWLYGSLDNDKWWRFSAVDEKILEENRRSHKISHIILGIQFEFDFHSMTQKNLRTGFLRPIKRVDIDELNATDVKGIAGVEILGAEEDIIQCTYQREEESDIESDDDDAENMEDEEINEDAGEGNATTHDMNGDFLESSDDNTDEESIEDEETTEIDSDYTYMTESSDLDEDQ